MKVEKLYRRILLLLVFTVWVPVLGLYLSGFILPSATVEAINVVGGETITRSSTDAEFRVFKTDTQTVETDTAKVSSKLKGQEKTNPLKIAEQASQDIQFLLDFHTPLADLGSDDPDKTVDPALCSIFHETIDGVPTLTSRNVVVTFFWDGTVYNSRLRDPNFQPPC